MNTQTQSNTAEQMTPCVNGVDVAAVGALIAAIEADTDNAGFKFRAGNRWLDGALNRTEIASYESAGTHIHRTHPFVRDNDEPPVLAGNDSAPNPVEYVLHALAGCLTTTLVYHAAVRDIAIQKCESELEGDIDLRGLFGMAENVRKGFSKVRVTLRVASDASAETLHELAMFSPVFDIVSNSLPVELQIEKI